MVSPPPSIAEWFPTLDFNTVMSPTKEEFIMPAGVPQLESSGHYLATVSIRRAFRWLLASSWRSKTTCNYKSLFKKWDSWCQEWCTDPIGGPIADVLNFLADLFDQGYLYWSLNSNWSAISSAHQKADGVEIGKHPLLARMLKGIFNERPPRPKLEDWHTHETDPNSV